MNFVSRAALAAAVTLCGVSFAATVPAFAKEAKPERNIQLSKEERAALVPLQTAVIAKDAAGVNAAIPAARAGATGPDARYAFGNLVYQHGRDTNNQRMQAEGIAAMIDSGKAPAADVIPLYSIQASIAVQMGDLATQDKALPKLVELSPNDPQPLALLAKLRHDQKRLAKSVTLLDRAIALKTATGQPADESWYKYALSNAYSAKLGPESFKASRALLNAYPTSQNWRDVLLVYRDLANRRPDNTIIDKALDIDIMRLQRFTKSLAGERDWADLAESLSKGGYPGEVKAVLDEGVAGKMIDGSRPVFAQLRSAAAAKIADDKASLPSAEKSARSAATGTSALKIADAYFGYGDYAKAVDLYRAALQKGSVDANLVNTRMGMALALAGQKAEAEAAFKSITGPRTEFADYLLLWLSKRT